jgi:DNA invertase Pin-like site-specific DNA recombinase
MSASPLVQPGHLSRRAAIYVRQSTGHQVLTNQESRRLQEAMREHARGLGWADERIELVDADTGRSGASASGRDAYRELLSDVALGRVGIVISYDSARLSRNCSDWYPLLDVCALKGCLVADRDGVYDPASVNGRLLLGMKGILSEVELHTMRGRLTAGLDAKARRGELAMALPVGYARDELGRVVKDPDIQVQEAIGLVFDAFLRRRSARRVVIELCQVGLRVPTRWRSDTVGWTRPSTARILHILKNPSYAGVYVYGRKRWKLELDSDGKRRPRYREPEECKVAIHDHHPAYVSWERHRQIQSILGENYAEYARRMSRGTSREGAALLQGIAYCGACGRKLRVNYAYSQRYLCNARQSTEGSPACQALAGEPIDEAVADAFVRALVPAELDVYERAVATRRESSAALEKAQERELQRLRYEADLARRRYERSDPENRLVTGELERRWEAALQALLEAEGRFASARAEQGRVVPFAVPGQLREAFTALGRSLPELWRGGSLSNGQRKALLRCLVDKVVLARRPAAPGIVDARVVWRGGATTEMEVRVHVRRMEELVDYPAMETEALAMATAGARDPEIAATLTARGHRSRRLGPVTPSMIETIRGRHRVLHRSRAPGHMEGSLTVRELAERVGARPKWIYAAIKDGRITFAGRDPGGLIRFPDSTPLIEALRGLRNHEVDHVEVGQIKAEPEHRDG